MKKIVLIFILGVFLIITPSMGIANTVTITIGGDLDPLGIEISGFQLFFHLPDGTYGYPLEMDWFTFDSDFTNTPNTAGQPQLAGWSIETLIVNEGDGVTVDRDLVRGIAGVSNNLNPVLKLREGLLLTMSSENTVFGINSEDSGNQFFNFAGSDGEVIPNLNIITSTDAAGNQSVNISAVPIPPAILLLGSGLVGLVAIRRRRS